MSDASNSSIERESNEVVFFNGVFKKLYDLDIRHNNISSGSVLIRTLIHVSDKTLKTKQIIVKTEFGDVILVHNPSLFKDKINIIVPEDYLFKVFFKTTTVATMDDIFIITGFDQDYNEKIYPNIHERIEKLKQCFR